LPAAWRRPDNSKYLTLRLKAIEEGLLPRVAYAAKAGAAFA
jgi:hypothetical protein